MYLITSDEQLRPYLPNALKTVAGELSFFDKLSADLHASEAWLTTHFIAPQLLETLGEEEKELGLALTRRIVVADALLRAIPQLDLVLTPNGFGIVSNQNVVPASKERIDRLMATLELTRDRALQQLLPMLTHIPDWPQASYFGATLFPFMDIAPLLGHRDHFWSRHQDYQPRLVQMEQELADKFISVALYQRLRRAQLSGSYSILEADLINRLRAVELTLLRGEKLPILELHSMVTLIRSNPEDFPEWAASSTAALYTDQSFHNKKQSSGYWF